MISGHLFSLADGVLICVERYTSHNRANKEVENNIVHWNELLYAPTIFFYLKESWLESEVQGWRLSEEEVGGGEEWKNLWQNPRMFIIHRSHTHWATESNMASFPGKKRLPVHRKFPLRQGDNSGKNLWRKGYVKDADSFTRSCWAELFVDRRESARSIIYGNKAPPSSEVGWRLQPLFFLSCL